MLSQSGPVAQAYGADDHRSDADARLVADHHVSRTVIDDRIILDQGVASHFEAPPGENVEPRVAADKRTAAFFVNKRVHEPAYPQAGPGVFVR